jgi:hypothetical protein
MTTTEHERQQEEQRRADAKQAVRDKGLAEVKEVEAAPQGAPVFVEPVFEGRSGALAVALRARNINVVAAEDAGDDGVKLTVEGPTGLREIELEGRDASFDVALAILGGKP